MSIENHNLIQNQVLILGGLHLNLAIKKSLSELNISRVASLPNSQPTVSKIWLKSFHESSELADLSFESHSTLISQVDGIPRHTIHPALTLIPRSKVHKIRQEVRRLQKRGAGLELLSDKALSAKFPELNIEDQHAVFENQVFCFDNTHTRLETEKIQIDSLIVENGAIKGVNTSSGPIRASYLVLLGDLFTKPLLEQIGIDSDLSDDQERSGNLPELCQETYVFSLKKENPSAHGWVQRFKNVYCILNAGPMEESVFPALAKKISREVVKEMQSSGYLENQLLFERRPNPKSPAGNPSSSNF